MKVKFCYTLHYEDCIIFCKRIKKKCSFCNILKSFNEYKINFPLDKLYPKICLNFKQAIYLNKFLNLKGNENQTKANNKQCQNLIGLKKKPTTNNNIYPEPHQQNISYNITNNISHTPSTNNSTVNKRPNITDTNYSPIRTRLMANAARLSELETEMRKNTDNKINEPESEIIQLSTSINTETKLFAESSSKNLRRQIISNNSNEKEQIKKEQPRDRSSSFEPKVKKVCKQSEKNIAPNEDLNSVQVNMNPNENKNPINEQNQIPLVVKPQVTNQPVNENKTNTAENISNPVYWTTSQVCKYLLDNKFDQSLVRMIEEQVNYII